MHEYKRPAGCAQDDARRGTGDDTEWTRDAARRSRDRRERIGKPAPRKLQRNDEPSGSRNGHARGVGEDPEGWRRAQAADAPQFRRDLDGVLAVERPDSESVRRVPGRAEAGDDVLTRVGA